GVRLLSRFRGRPRRSPRRRGARGDASLVRMGTSHRYVPRRVRRVRGDGGLVATLIRAVRDDVGRAPNDVFGSFIDETIGIVARQTRDTVSFAVGSPAREALDLVKADDLAATVIRREGASALGYTMTEGEPELRELVAASARRRGVRP